MEGELELKAKPKIHGGNKAEGQEGKIGWKGNGEMPINSDGMNHSFAAPKEK